MAYSETALVLAFFLKSAGGPRFYDEIENRTSS
jgi:hypothetical protein